MVSSCFEYMFDGPITLTRAALSTTKHGLCGGAVDFIILQGLILQLLYLVGGVAYFTFIMKLHPSHYYGKIFPGMSIVFMIACGLQFIPMPEMVAAVTISTVTVLSYYMSIYNSYMLSGASRAELFGFVQAVYSAAVGLAGFLPSVLQLIKASQGTLMAVALVMATWGLLQSLYLYRRNFADHGRVKTVRE
ncbi:hypothetical protein CLOM_g6291 [Closterium sp. NIES-68]|nr:hypothetical protein CLOM_g6291 [Closterium sp. NIES-68]GJP67586.1 hypothetical protein CLOP_g24392 [Closterium sp. NIES-67]